MLITSVTGPCNPIIAVTLASQKLASVQRCSVSSSFRAAEKYRPDSGAFTSQVQYLHPHCTSMKYIHTFIQEYSNILMWTKNCIMEKRLNSKIQCLKIDDLQSQVWHVSWFWTQLCSWRWKSATHCVLQLHASSITKNRWRSIIINIDPDRCFLSYCMYSFWMIVFIVLNYFINNLLLLLLIRVLIIISYCFSVRPTRWWFLPVVCFTGTFNIFF